MVSAPNAGELSPSLRCNSMRGLRDIGVLMEPATILAKAWDHIERIGERAKWKPRTLLVTGAGTVGLAGGSQWANSAVLKYMYSTK